MAWKSISDFQKPNQSPLAFPAGEEGSEFNERQQISSQTAGVIVAFPTGAGNQKGTWLIHCYNWQRDPTQLLGVSEAFPGAG